MTDELVAGAAGFDAAGPARDEGNAVAAVPDVGLGPAEVGADLVALFGQLSDAGGLGAAIVTGEDQQRVVGQLVGVERLQEFAERVVGLHHEIAVGT